MTVRELIAFLETFDQDLKVGWNYDGRWMDKLNVEFVRGSEDWGEPKEDSVRLAYS